ncbi:MAG: HD domain-containing protein [Desulfomonile tiedjei]|uniref:HD domain-containing protein n=1 Tax=Desulfomonile tiedjei TaxID=2358 RepID=A0A9D6Z241_9BACT|nr:HD domain-containing protein [Desulfomonile tiedjei]
MDERYKGIYELAKPFLNTRDNEAHTRVAYSFAKILMEAEGGDEGVVLPAIILHDVGWKIVPEELQLTAFGPGKNNMAVNRIHEVEGARIAKEILRQLKYDQALTDQIVEIIMGHDSRKEPVSRNDAIVKDADKLWRFSQEALQIDPARFGIDPKVHTAWLKEQIDDWFITKTAASIARHEHKLRAESFKDPLGAN